MPKARVFLDSNIYKFSATQLPRFRPREAAVRWGGRMQPLRAHDLVTVNPNEKIRNPELKAEAELLPKVAALADAGLAIFQISLETLVEVWGIPDLDSERGCFYGTQREIVKAPVEYGRILI